MGGSNQFIISLPYTWLKKAKLDKNRKTVLTSSSSYLDSRTLSTQDESLSSLFNNLLLLFLLVAETDVTSVISGFN